jgi:hypothetical protein
LCWKTMSCAAMFPIAMFPIWTGVVTRFFEIGLAI